MTRPSTRGAVLAALLGVAFCLWSYGATILDGESIDWLMGGDRAQSFLGWHFYRNATESFPLGDIPSLLAPVGASLAYTDAVPWFAVALKPLSPFLPATFQTAGIWLFLAYALQGVFAFLVLRLLLGDQPLALAGSLLVVMSPVLARRGAHFALCAQWLLLAAGYLFLRTRDEHGVARFALPWLPLLLLAGGTHPYLTTMVAVLALAACGNGTPLARLAFRAAPTPAGGRAWLRVVAVRVLVVLATLALALLVFGYVGAPSSGAPGFGSYTANLLTLVDADGESKLLADLPSTPEQAAHGFLGIGALVLVVAGAIGRLAALRAPRSDRGLRLCIAPETLGLLGVGIAAMALFALGPRIAAGSVEIASARGFYQRLEPLPSTFRASGRFFWPLHYVVLLGAVVWVATSLRRRSVALVVLLLAILLQLWDSAGLYTGNDARRQGLANRWNPLRSPAWRAAGDDYDELRLVPPYVHEAPCPGAAYPPYFYVPFAYQAGRQGMRINSGHLSRQPYEAIAAACRSLEDAVACGRMEPDAIYVVRDDVMPRFTAAKLGLATCGRLDGFNVCVSAARRTRFAALLPFRPQQYGACVDLRPRFKKSARHAGEVPRSRPAADGATTLPRPEHRERHGRSLRHPRGSPRALRCARGRHHLPRRHRRRESATPSRSWAARERVAVTITTRPVASAAAP